MRTRIGSTIAVVAVAALLSACGSDSDDKATTAASTATEAAASQTWLEDAKKAAAEATTMPTKINQEELGPVKAPSGLKLAFVGCDQSIPGCVAQVEGFRQAAEAIGASVKVCDAKFDVAAFQNCMSQAVEAKPDAIVNNARPQSDAPEAYAAAHEAKIPVIGQFTSEKPNPETGNAAEVGYVCELEGEILGNYIVASSEGKANVAVAADTVYRCNGQRADGVKKALDACPTCKTEVKQFSAGTAQTDLPPLLQAQIQANSDLNWIVGTPGFAGTMAADAIRQASKESAISVGTFDGDPPELSLLRKGDIVKADVLSGVHENGWVAVDTILRLKAGQEIPDNINNPTQMLFTEENVPAKGTFEGGEGFREQFKALWGVA